MLLRAALPLLLALAMCCGAEMGAAAVESVTEKCRRRVDDLSDCIAYATGKEDAPTEQCCTMVTGIRNTDPVCLCYVIQKANCGRQAVFSMVLQIGRLLNLSKSCNLSGITDIRVCPALLGLPEDSPDNFIFNGSGPSNRSVTCTPDSAFSIRSNSATELAFVVLAAIFSSILSF